MFFETFTRDQLICLLKELHKKIGGDEVLSAAKRARIKLCACATSEKQRQFQIEKYEQKQVVFQIAYDGSKYSGLVEQAHTNNTVEAHLIKALQKTCIIKRGSHTNLRNDRKCLQSKCFRSTYSRSGRTDAGVSAFCQVLSLCARSSKNHIPTTNNQEPKCKHQKYSLDYIFTLNRVLPKDIRLLSIAAPPRSFHAVLQLKCFLSPFLTLTP